MSQHDKTFQNSIKICKNVKKREKIQDKMHRWEETVWFHRRINYLLLFEFVLFV